MRAKAELQITDQLQFVKAEPGCGRLISFESHPAFFCDYAIVRTDRQQAASDVLAWYTGIQLDNRAHGGEEWLSRVMGGTVREVDE